MTLWSEEDRLNVQRYIDDKFEEHRKLLAKTRQALELSTLKLAKQDIVINNIEKWVKITGLACIEQTIIKYMLPHFESFMKKHIKKMDKDKSKYIVKVI